MGSRYTEEVDNQVQSLIDDYIAQCFNSQVNIADYTNAHVKDVTPQTALYHAQTLGDFATSYTRECNIRLNRLADDLAKIGVPVCKQII